MAKKIGLGRKPGQKVQTAKKPATTSRRTPAQAKAAAKAHKVKGGGAVTSVAALCSISANKYLAALFPGAVSALRVSYSHSRNLLSFRKLALASSGCGLQNRRQLR